MSKRQKNVKPFAEMSACCHNSSCRLSNLASLSLKDAFPRVLDYFTEIALRILNPVKR